MVSSKMDHHQQRTLCSTSSTVPQHDCFNPEEKDVISPIPPTPAPSISPQPTSFRTGPNDCVADGQGNYGTIDGPSSHQVEYRYQVETAEGWTAFQLNVEVLQDVEKAISDLMVQRYFLEQCSPPVIDIFGADNGITTSNAATAAPLMMMGPQQPRVANPFPGEGGGFRKLLLLQSKNKSLRRHLKSEDHQALVGLSADPIDLVLEGDEGEACPFPITNGPCFVVGGGLTVFGDDPEGTENQMLWVDEGIQEELKLGMDSGDLEQQMQKAHPDILAIRYIPPGTVLPIPSNPDGNNGDNAPIGADRRSAVSWTLVGLGLLIISSVVLYWTLMRRRIQDREEERNAAVVGAFPTEVTQQSINQMRRSEESNRSKRPGRSRRNPNIYQDISNQYSNSPEVKPDSGAFGEYDSNNNNSIGDEDPLLVFQDGVSPGQRVSTSWQDQVLSLDNQTSLNPDRPFVRTPGDDHFESASEGYPSSYDAGSSRSSSPRHSTGNRSNHSSPSKLTVAFTRSGEIT